MSMRTLLDNYDRYSFYGLDEAYDIIDCILNDEYASQTWIHSHLDRWVFLDGKNSGLRIQAFVKGHNFYLPFMIGSMTVELVWDPKIDENELMFMGSKLWSTNGYI